MKKICSHCLHMFDEVTLPEYCPLVDCSDGYLIDIDDLFVDVIKKFWEREISTRFCCSGHLYKSCFQPYIMFDGVYLEFMEMDLSRLRDLFVDVDAGRNLVSIDKMADKNDMPIFVVSGVCDLREPDRMQRLKCQMSFFELLYDVIKSVDVLIEHDAEEVA